MALDRDWVRARILGELDDVRKDAIKFAVLTVLLTPVFMLLAVFLFIGAVQYADLPFFDHLAFRDGFAVGGTAALTLMLVAYHARPKPKWLERATDGTWELASAAAWVALVAVTFVPAVRAHGAFWLLYAAAAFTFLGLLGRAYEARESYYLGWFGGWAGDPFTIQDDIDRAHVSLGIALSVPYALLEAYGDILGSSWVWRGIDETEAQAAADAMIAGLAGKPDEVVRALSRLPLSSRMRVSKALLKLEFVQPGPAFRLSQSGKRFLHEAGGLVAAT